MIWSSYSVKHNRESVTQNADLYKFPVVSSTTAKQPLSAIPQWDRRCPANALLALAPCTSVTKGIGSRFPLLSPVISMLAQLRNDRASTVFRLDFLIASANLYFVRYGNIMQGCKKTGCSLQCLGNFFMSRCWALAIRIKWIHFCNRPYLFQPVPFRILVDLRWVGRFTDCWVKVYFGSNTHKMCCGWSSNRRGILEERINYRVYSCQSSAMYLKSDT